MRASVRTAGVAASPRSTPCTKHSRSAPPGQPQSCVRDIRRRFGFTPQSALCQPSAKLPMSEEAEPPQAERVSAGCCLGEARGAAGACKVTPKIPAVMDEEAFEHEDYHAPCKQLAFIVDNEVCAEVSALQVMLTFLLDGADIREQLRDRIRIMDVYTMPSHGGHRGYAAFKALYEALASRAPGQP